MNSAAIVEEDAELLPTEVEQITVGMADLMERTVRASFSVRVPKNMRTDNRYAGMIVDNSPMKLDPFYDDTLSVKEKVNAAAEHLFLAFD
jgi:hypothetical protein